MFFRHIVLFVVIACVSQNEASEVLKSTVIDKEILQQFLNLVKANQLNVSIVTSKGEYWTNGLLQELWDVALQLPTNKVHLTKSTLTPQVGKQWISDLQSVTGVGKGIGTYRIVSLQNGRYVQQVVESSNKEEIPVSPSYEAIVGLKNGHIVSSLENPNQLLINKYVIPGTDGHNETVKVIGANLNVTMIEKSDSMPVVEMDTIMKMIPKMWLMYDDYTLMAEGMVEVLEKQFPQSNWQVIIGAEKYYLDAVKHITVSIANLNITIFAIHMP